MWLLFCYTDHLLDYSDEENLEVDAIYKLNDLYEKYSKKDPEKLQKLKEKVVVQIKEWEKKEIIRKEVIQKEYEEHLRLIQEVKKRKEEEERIKREKESEEERFKRDEADRIRKSDEKTNELFKEKEKKLVEEKEGTKSIENKTEMKFKENGEKKRSSCNNRNFN